MNRLNRPFWLSTKFLVSTLGNLFSLQRFPAPILEEECVMGYISSQKNQYPVSLKPPDFEQPIYDGMHGVGCG